MTIVLDSPVPRVFDVLRGERHHRPAADRTSASGLRAILDDAIFEILGAHRPSTPFVIRSSSLRDPSTIDVVPSPLGRLRGVLIVELLRLTSVGIEVNRPFADALDAWRSESTSGELPLELERLDHDELARLATDVEAHWTTLRRALGVVPGQWLPRTALHLTHRLGAGDVVLMDTIDLMFGSTNNDVANVTILDVTSSPLGPGAQRAMRYHALVETLRSGVAPLRTSSFSTATGEFWTRDVDYELLRRSTDDVRGALERLWSRR